MKRNFLTMLVLSLTSWLMAQNYSIIHLGMAESLSNNYVADMTLDKYGFLWVATEEGLNRFDGSYFFTYYNIRSNKQSISSNELNCILDDPQEPIMWIGTKNDGLNAYNYDTGEFQLYKHDVHNPNSISTNDITCISPASDNNIWVSTYWKGVQKFDKKSGKFIHYNTQNTKGLPDNQFWCVRELGNGTLLAGHVTNGFSIIDSQKHIAHNFKHDSTNTSSLSGNEVNCIYQDSNGTIWVGTDKGVDIYNPTTHNFTHIAERETDKHRVFDIKEFSDGKIWIGTEQKGIIILNTNNSYHPNGLSVQVIKEGETPYTLTGSTIRCLLEDPYHNVWAGVYGSGVNFLTLHQPPFQVISFGPLI